MNDVGTVERAFQLAKSPNITSINDIERKLDAEGYEGVTMHLSGTFLRKQLRAELQRLGSERSTSV